MPSRSKAKHVVADGGGLRYDGDKNQLELIPPEWIWGLGQLFTIGAVKYAERNWERGMPWGKMVGCGLRHTFKFIGGERYDKETGVHHLICAAWNLLGLMSYDLRNIGENTLPGQVDATAFKTMFATSIKPELLVAPKPKPKRKN